MVSNPAIPFSSDDPLPSLDGAAQWLNSPPFTRSTLRGKVVLINFWTYTCINWIRTLPYIRAWAEKYQGQGLVVIGIHTPEFLFEHDLDNLRQAVHDLNVNYPVAVDNNYAIWNAFGNRYWPALYLIDVHGHFRYHQFGEGSYEQSERMIQQLLAEAGQKNVSNQLVNVDAQGVEAAIDWDNLQSPENYLGYDRTRNFASPGGEVIEEPHHYDMPTQINLNAWALAGNWTMKHNLIRLNEKYGRVTCRFHARDLHLVMGPTAKGTSMPFQVFLDGQPPLAAHGVDVDERGYGAMNQQRLHQLIRQSEPITDHQFEIVFLNGGVDVYVFTYG